MKSHWLTRRRSTLYSGALLLIYLIFMGIFVAKVHGGIDSFGNPLGHDFIVYWGASHLALSGNAVGAYNPPTLLAAQKLAIAPFPGAGPWLYPPTFYLIALPLALMPYFISYFAFVGSTFIAYLAVLRRVIAVPGSWLPLLAFPAIAINVIQGQNAFLTAALMGGALLLLSARPTLAGVLIGLLVIKPQMGLLLPLLLICGRHWRALFAATLTAVIFCCLSAYVLGADTVAAFFSGMKSFSIWAAQNAQLLRKMPTFFAFGSLLGMPGWARILLQLAVAVPVSGASAWVWFRSKDLPLRAASLLTASLLVTPYVLDYDLTWLGLAIAWFAGYGLQHGWLRGERETLVVAWLLPLIIWLLQVFTVRLDILAHLQLAPFVLLALFLMILRRVGHEIAAQASIGPASAVPAPAEETAAS